MTGRTWSLLAFAAAALTVARTFRVPATYATGHWLLNYDHGVVKRGLLGAAVRPLLALKSAAEVREVVETFSLIAIVGLLAAFVAAARPLLHASEPFATRWALRIAVFAVATSPWVVFVGHLNGFLDHAVALLTLGCVALTGTRGRWLVPWLCVAGVGIHELFVAFGLPVVCLAVLAGGDGRRRRVWFEALAVLIPTLLVTLWLLASAEALSTTRVDAVRDDVRRYGLLDRQAAENAVFHLRNDAFETSAQSPADGWSRVARLDYLAVVGPTLALIATWIAVWVRAPGLRRWGVLALPVVLAPMALHWAASDTGRFTTMTIFSAFVAWLVLVRHLPRPEPSRAAPLLALAGLAAIGANVHQSVPLMSDEIDGDGVLSVRAGPTPNSFAGCTPVFQNADFEAGSLVRWTATGDGFAVLSGTGKRGGRSRIGSVGHRWLTTGGPDGEDDALVGELVSVDFLVRGDVLLFTIGGGSHREELRVSLVVDGEEVAWATGLNDEDLTARRWDTSEYHGKTGHLVIRDGRSKRWGHLNVDGFCWFRS